MFPPSPSSATLVEQSNPPHSSGNGLDAQTHASEAGEHRVERSPMATQAERTGESDVNTVSAVGRVPVESKPVWDQTYLIPDIDPELMSFFGPEARDCLDTIEASLLQLEGDPQNAETLQDLFRNVHTLKGSGYTVGYAVIGDLVHPLEDLLGEIREGRVFFAPRFADLIPGRHRART